MKMIKSQRISIFVRYLTVLILGWSAHAYSDAPAKTVATIKTNLGSIELELFKDRTPKTVENFISYVNDGYYNNTIFHRVIANFMVQGGGFDTQFRKKQTKSPIKNEANAFIPNIRGTISMARTSDPHSATSQFFINVKDNSSLNKSSANAGYAVFGKVINGMSIADQISKVKTTVQNYMRDVPADQVIIQSISITEPTPVKVPEAPSAMTATQK
jgi:cyclophilin family peptidyl-prolyl cis-trans isomerase